MSTVTTAEVVVLDEGLHRGLNRTHALAIVIGAVLGAAIYIRPAYIAQLVATPVELMAVWAAAGLFCLGGALTYGELAARVPRSGGEYAFLRVTLGELPAFLYGWMRLTVGLGGVASMALAASSFFADLVPLGRAWDRIEWPALGLAAAIDFGPRQAVAVLFIALLAAINIRGVGTAGRLQTALTSIKVVALLALVTALFVMGHPPAAVLPGPVSLTPGSREPFAYSAAVLAGVSAYNGWQLVAMVGGEVQDARRTLRWALTVGILVAIALYLTVNLAYLHVLSMEDLRTAFSTQHPEAASVASRAATLVLGAHVGRLLPLLFLVSTLGALHCNLLSMPRVLFAMARDGLLPRRVGSVAVRSRAPVVAIVVLATLATGLVLLGTYDRVANMMAFGCLLFFAVNAYGLLYLQHAKRSVGVDRPSRRASVVPTLFLCAATVLLLTLIARGTVEILAAVGVIGIGVPVFYAIRAWKAFRK